ncbi:uncharacterized protein LOC129601820 [Paramacrobiotus metropolitanus]|uniref:uncharacterized protein LOC129601820 n=1 Tax=Paramacrobiotus metropolitanus TaxID=2943436 RepID=UPI002446178C|nr:uncharacterized protein LOC129601820 [Paramacrobiotus metropolitanus]
MWFAFYIILLWTSLTAGQWNTPQFSFDRHHVDNNNINMDIPAFVVNLTLEKEDGSYVDSRQITVTLSPDVINAIPSEFGQYIYPLPNTDSRNIPSTDWYYTWTTFTEWSACSADCGPGLQFAERFCVQVLEGSHVVAAASTVDPCLDRDISQNITTSVAQSSAGQSSQKRYRQCHQAPCQPYHLTPPDQHQPNDQTNNLTLFNHPHTRRREPLDPADIKNEYEDNKLAIIFG